MIVVELDFEGLVHVEAIFEGEPPLVEDVVLKFCERNKGLEK